MSKYGYRNFKFSYRQAKSLAYWVKLHHKASTGLWEFYRQEKENGIDIPVESLLLDWLPMAEDILLEKQVVV